MRAFGPKASPMGKAEWSTLMVGYTKAGGELASVMVVAALLVLLALCRKAHGSVDALRVEENS